MKEWITKYKAKLPILCFCCAIVLIVGILNKRIRFHFDASVDFTSFSVREDSEHFVNVRIPLNLSAPEFADYVLGERRLKENVDTVLRVAKILENSRFGKGLLSALNHTVDFDPDKGDTARPGGVYSYLDFKYPWERQKQAEEVNVTKDIEQDLDLIVRKYSALQQKRARNRQGKNAGLYSEQE